MAVSHISLHTRMLSDHFAYWSCMIVVMCFLAVAAVYGYIKQPMKALYVQLLFCLLLAQTDIVTLISFRWSPGKHPNHTVHVEDVAGALLACAEWIAKTGRKEANSIAGEEVVFKNDKSKIKELQAQGVQGLVGADRKCIAPAFNLVSFVDHSQRRLSYAAGPRD